MEFKLVGKAIHIRYQGDEKKVALDYLDTAIKEADPHWRPVYQEAKEWYQKYYE